MNILAETEIQGVRLSRPKVFADDRGAFCEAFRASWFAGDRRWVQWNISKSAAGVLRGLHFHKLQTDYWLVTHGRVTAALVDLRPRSPTLGKAILVELAEDNPQGLIIPPGVLHGYRASVAATVMYLVDVEYTGKDEYGVRWNDPALKLPTSWYAGPAPTLSGRDAAAPNLQEAMKQLQAP